MTKKDYQLFAEALAKIKNNTNREALINFLTPIFRQDNNRFDEGRFKEFIDRRINNKSLKGLNVNPKYLYN